MTEDQNHKNPPMDDLDRALDAALAKYAAVDPRAGLEGRILANLQAQPSPPASHSWWLWGIAAALALILLTLGLAWKSGRTAREIVVERPARSAPATSAVGESHLPKQFAEAAQNRSVPKAAIQHKKSAESRSVTAASVPKREQFPSPQPLSDQERLLASYVANDPHHAVLIARAQTEAARQDREEEMREAAATENRDFEQARH